MDGNFWRQLSVFLGPIFALAWAVTACDGTGCQLHSDCAADQQCVESRCAQRCGDDFDCVRGEACESGACVVSPDAVRPRPCDPATNEAGCSDTSTPPDAAADVAVTSDVPIADAVSDLSTSLNDALADGGLASDGAADAGGSDGSVEPGAVDLTGTYAVTRTVDLTNDDNFTEGDVDHFIANLTRLAEHHRYRMDFIDPEGHALMSEVAVDFRSPEGPFHYQFRFERPLDTPPPGCRAFEETFERGEAFIAEPEVTLEGQQILHGQYEGEQCAEADRLTNFTVRWVRIPTPVPTGDGGPALGDAGPASDGGQGDAVPGVSDAAVPGVSDAARLEGDSALVQPAADAATVADAATPDAVAR